MAPATFACDQNSSIFKRAQAGEKGQLERSLQVHRRSLSGGLPADYLTSRVSIMSKQYFCRNIHYCTTAVRKSQTTYKVASRIQVPTFVPWTLASTIIHVPSRLLICRWKLGVRGPFVSSTS